MSDRCPDHVWEIEGDISPDQLDVIREVLPKAAANGEEIVVVAGVTLRRRDVRSQPASEPSLDVARLSKAMVAWWNAPRKLWPAIQRVTEDVLAEDARMIAEFYAAQPADNEAAE